jgi:hypothetical protein
MSGDATCSEIRDAYKAIDRDKNLSTAGFIVAGVGAVGALTYYLWPRSSTETRTGRTIRPVALASTNGASVWLTGNF